MFFLNLDYTFLQDILLVMKFQLDSKILGGKCYLIFHQLV